jgi:phage terminase Nu1 subunit (DNA packaging protein)
MFRVNVPMGKNEMETVSASELASLLLVSRKTVAEWAALGVVVRIGHGRYDLRESVRGFAKHMHERDRGGDVAAVASVAQERARVLRLQGDRIEREAAKEAGKLVDADAFGEAMTITCRGLRIHMMLIPQRVGGRAPHLSRQDIGLIDAEVRDALTEVSTMSLGQLREIAQGAKELAPPIEGVRP